MEKLFRHCASVFLFIVLLCSLCTAQAQTEIKELGRSPFIKPELKTVTDLQNMVKQMLPDLKKGFELAGASELVDEFVSQVDQANIEEVDVPVGEKLQWMIFKKAQRVEVLKGVIWAGKEPFKAFQLIVDRNGVRNIFIVPLICGNVSLARTTAIPVPTPVVIEETAPITPPVVAAPVPVPAITTEAPLIDPAPKRGHIVVDLGYLHQPDPANYMLFRIGYAHRFHEHFSLLGMIGFAPVFRGDDDTDSIMADLTANYHYHRMYLGAGIGFWHSSMKDRADLILNAGYRILGEANQRNLSLFVEGRLGVEDFNDFNDYVRYGGGLRYQF